MANFYQTHMIKPNHMRFWVLLTYLMRFFFAEPAGKWTVFKYIVCFLQYDEIVYNISVFVFHKKAVWISQMKSLQNLQNSGRRASITVVENPNRRRGHVFLPPSCKWDFHFWRSLISMNSKVNISVEEFLEISQEVAEFEGEEEKGERDSVCVK